MKLALAYRLNANWAPGAWVARCGRETDQVHVAHGSAVVTNADWFGEIVWAGPFAEASFDTTDIVFGWGGRLRGGHQQRRRLLRPCYRCQHG